MKTERPYLNLLPNRQNQVKGNFAYLALDGFCHIGKVKSMNEEGRTYPNRIRELREDAEMTIEELADRTGLSTSYVSRLENGERNLSLKNLNLFADALSTTPSHLLPAEEETAPRTTVRVMGRIGAGAEISPDMEQVPPEGLFEIESPVIVTEDAIAFEVIGESMWPRYDPGDIIVVWRQGSDATDVLGWEAAVRTSSGQRYLKRVLKGAKVGTFDLESHNAPPIRGVVLEWVAAIQAVIRADQWRKLNERGRKRLMRKVGAA